MKNEARVFDTLPKRLLLYFCNICVVFFAKLVCKLFKIDLLVVVNISVEVIFACACKYC